MFQFPFGTMHQLNLDWFLIEWEVYKEQWADAQAAINLALQGEIDRVEDAMTDLYNARDVAVAAKDDAVLAKNDAVSAKNDAVQAKTDAQTAKAAADADALAAATYKNLSETYARGTMGGTPVNPGDPGYQDNAKYYKEQADADATQAHTDALAIAANIDKAEGFAVGEQSGTPVDPTSPYYHNNAAYYAAQTAQDKDDADHFKDGANAAALVAEGYSSGTQNGTPVSSGSPYYENNAAYFYGLSAGTSGDLAQDMIAGKEASSVASAAHAKGSLFIYNGVLYVATANISIGDTIYEGSNCERTTLAAKGSENDFITHNSSPSEYILNNILCDDYSVSGSGRTFIKKFNYIESSFLSTSGQARSAPLTGTTPTTVSTFNPENDTPPLANLADIKFLKTYGCDLYLRRIANSNYAGTNRGRLIFIFCSVDENNVVTKLSSTYTSLITNDTFMMKLTVPDGTTHFAIYQFTTGASATYKTVFELVALPTT